MDVPGSDVEVTAATGDVVVAVPTSDRPEVSIVLVTFGTGEIVLDALRAVATSTTLPVEVIVVDNPPADGDATRAMLRERTSGVRLLTPERNLGFGGGNDLGIDHADAATVCLLNPDVIVGPGWLEPLVAALDDPVVGIAGPVFVDPDGELSEAGQLVLDDGSTVAFGGPYMLGGDWSQVFTRDVDYVSAACWVLRRADHLELGGFDERYHPAFFEDADYALRVESHGRRSRLVAAVVVQHHHGQGGAGRDLELGEASREVFREVWAERLSRQHPWPVSVAEARANRDRLADDRVAWAVRAVDRLTVERATADAVEHARSAPRARTVLLVSDDASIDVPGARAAGVEVVVGDVDASLADRAGELTDIHVVADPPSPWHTPVRLVLAAVGALATVALLVRSRRGTRSSPYHPATGV